MIGRFPRDRSEGSLRSLHQSGDDRLENYPLLKKNEIGFPHELNLLYKKSIMKNCSFKYGVIYDSFHTFYGELLHSQLT